MSMRDTLRQKQEAQEDAFIDRAEKAINAGKSFDEEFQTGWDVNYRLSPEWRKRYEDMSEKAKSYHTYHKAWSADGVRKEIQDLRQAQREQETEEAFYQSNRFQLVSAVESGATFADTGMTPDMKPLFQRAQKEVLGYVPEEEPAPMLDPFLAGFSD